MPLIEAALAFAITMLALSLIVSSLVEIIHRFFKMREAGLKYMLGQLFDQVLVKYVKPLADAKEGELRNDPRHQGKPAAVITRLAYRAVRDGFVQRMIANRAPVGLKADKRLAADAVPTTAPPPKPRLQFGNIWGGRRVTQLASADFMERLGNSEVGEAIEHSALRGGRTTMGTADAIVRNIAEELQRSDISEQMSQAQTAEEGARIANAVLKSVARDLGQIEITKATTLTGQAAADAVDTLLKDIAQKFDGFGKDAATYFEGRARFMSVMIAIGLAFAVHVDAIDLFKTYLRDPNARAKVIEQSQAVTAQYKASQEAAKAVKELAPKPDAPTPEEAKKLEDAKKAADASKSDAEKAKEQEEINKQKAEQAKKADEIKKEVEDLEKDAREAIANARATVKQYADLGVPIGWNEDRRNAANMKMLVWSCKELKDEKTASLTWWTFWRDCKPDDPKVDEAAKDDKKGDTPPALDKKADATPAVGNKDDTTPVDGKKGDGVTHGDKKGGTAPALDKSDAATKGGKKDDTTAKERKDLQYVTAWVEVPWTLSAWVYLTLGGLLIGLGSPFWYDAVTSLTNLRSAAKGSSGSDTSARAPAVARATPPDLDKAQPVTPVGAFQVSNAARKI